MRLLLDAIAAAAKIAGLPMPIEYDGTETNIVCH
jgi:hypothetical protein